MISIFNCQVKSALEALDPIHHVQVRRCDESGGSGGSGGWLGGCPYAKRNGYSWEVVFESSYYENELNTKTGKYQYHGEHKYIDEAPLSLTKSQLTPFDLLREVENSEQLETVESVVISNIDLSTNLIYFDSSPSFNLVPKMKMVIKPIYDDVTASRSIGDEPQALLLTVVEVKSSVSVVVTVTGEEGAKLSSSLIGQDIYLGSHWSSHQVYRMYV